jgi:hypothetical protein
VTPRIKARKAAEAPGGQLVHAGERLGQSRLSDAVLADDGVNFSVLQREICYVAGATAAQNLPPRVKR